MTVRTSLFMDPAFAYLPITLIFILTPKSVPVVFPWMSEIPREWGKFEP